MFQVLVILLKCILLLLLEIVYHVSGVVIVSLSSVLDVMTQLTSRLSKDLDAMLRAVIRLRILGLLRLRQGYECRISRDLNSSACSIA